MGRGRRIALAQSVLPSIVSTRGFHLTWHSRGLCCKDYFEARKIVSVFLLCHALKEA
jgi:hypothetical protein